MVNRRYIVGVVGLLFSVAMVGLIGSAWYKLFSVTGVEALGDFSFILLILFLVAAGASGYLFLPPRRPKMSGIDISRITKQKEDPEESVSPIHTEPAKNSVSPRLSTDHELGSDAQYAILHPGSRVSVTVKDDEGKEFFVHGEVCQDSIVWASKSSKPLESASAASVMPPITAAVAAQSSSKLETKTRFFKPCQKN